MAWGEFHRGHWSGGGVVFSVNADGHMCVVSTAEEKSPGRGAFPGLGAKKELGRFKKGHIRKDKCPGTPIRCAQRFLCVSKCRQEEKVDPG